MSEEIFDVVDPNDQVIGQQSRSEVHRLGLRHRAIHLLVFNAKGELFLQKRSMKKDCFPGTWDSSVSGHVDTGEEYDACALREPREEIGLELAAVPERLFKIDACEATGQEFVGCTAASTKARSNSTPTNSPTAAGSRSKKSPIGSLRPPRILLLPSC